MRMTKRPNAAAARRAIRERAQVEGAMVAYEAALELCRDKKAPAQARSAAIASIFRISGLFERAPTDDMADRPIDEIPPEEMSRRATAAIRNSERRVAAMLRAKEARGEEGDLTDEDYDRAEAEGLDVDDDDYGDDDEMRVQNAFD